jgi:hypothetical protein
MLTKVLRLVLLMGALLVLHAVNPEPVAAISYCCDTCDALEMKFYADCPGGREQSEECDRMWKGQNHCWLFCSTWYCNYNDRPICDLFCFSTPDWWCWNLCLF